MPEELMYSSQLSSLTFTTADDVVDIIVFDDDQQTKMMDCRLYSYKGKVTLYDVREIVEEYMKMHGLSFMKFWVRATNRVGGASIDVGAKVLFCSFSPNIAAPLFASRYFLTTLSAMEFDADNDVYLSAYHEKGEAIVSVYNIVYRTISGEIKAERFEERSIAGETGITDYMVCYLDIMSYVWSDDCKEMISLNFQIGNRMMIFYLREKPVEVCFSFRNAFNCWEDYYLQGSTNVKTSTDKSEAICSGTIQHYDKRNKQLFEVKTAPMRTEEAEWLTQFLLSHHIFKGSNNEEQRIIIEEFTHEVTDDDAGKHKIEFTWRYAKADKFALELPTSHNARVFTKQFKDTFQ